MIERFEQDNRLRGETLVRKGTTDIYEDRPQIRIAPDLNVIKLGGHGIIDYGRKVVMPLVEELGPLSLTDDILIVTGGGVRVRHVLDVGLDLGMPTGVLADLAGRISEQNAIMISLLLGAYNAVRISADDLLEIPSMMHLGQLPILPGTPPYGFFEYSGPGYEIPSHRTDTGAFLVAEVLGARSCIIGKNVDGMYDKNPLKYDDAELIPDITASELLEMNMEDMVCESKMLELMLHSRHLKEVKIVNAHHPGEITRVVRGEMPGTIIRAK